MFFISRNKDYHIDRKKISDKWEVMKMKQSMKAYAEKLMMKAHAAVEKYQSAQESHKSQSIAQQNMLYGSYLIDINETL
jgi:hypothetical protein